MKTAIIIVSMFMGISSYALDLKKLNLQEVETVQPQKKPERSENKLSDLIKREECKQSTDMDEKECDKFKKKDHHQEE